MENQASKAISYNWKSDIKIQLLLFIAIFAIFVSARASQLYDSQFTFLLSYTIYHDQSLDLKPYLDFPGLRDAVEEVMPGSVFKVNPDSDNEQWRYAYPNTSAILSIPYVFIMDKLGYDIVVGDPPHWQFKNEEFLQKILCALISAFYAVILYRLARLWLPINFSVLISIVLIIGSSVASVISRALWADTLAVLFLLIATYHLAVSYKKQKSFNFAVLIISLGLSVLCKPTYLIPALSAGLWAMLIDRKKTWLALSGALCLVIIGMVYNYLVSGKVLGIYSFNAFTSFEASRIAGLLISPGRGMFIYWSWFLFSALLWALVYKKLSSYEKKIILLAILPLIISIIYLSFFWFWFGGSSYGPRLLIPTLPWLSLLSVIVLAKYLEINNLIAIKHEGAKAPNSKTQAVLLFGFITCLFAIVINMFGANQPKAHDQWYRMALPEGKTIDYRMWLWSDPPFLAGIIRPERYFNYVIELDSADVSLPSNLKTNDDIHKLIHEKMKGQQ